MQSYKEIYSLLEEAQQAALLLLCVSLLGVVAFRCYYNHFIPSNVARPSELQRVGKRLLQADALSSSKN